MALARLQTLKVAAQIYKAVQEVTIDAPDKSRLVKNNFIEYRLSKKRREPRLFAVPNPHQLT